MTIRRPLIAAALAVLAFWLVACGGPASRGSAPAGTQQPSAAGPVVDVTIAKGQITPTNATVQAKARQPITFRVTSDAIDELHVHSVPGHQFQVAAAANQTFQFTVDVPGNVDVELHHLDRVVATIQVRP